MLDTASKFSQIIRLAIFFVVWFAVLLGVLQCGPYLGNLGHGLCGPWGCGPPTEALIVYHGFWFILLGGPTLLALWYWQPSTLGIVGKVLFFLGLSIAVAVIGWELAHLSPRMRPLALQRIGFALVTLVDVPIFQTMAVGILFWFVAGKKRRRELPETEEEAGFGSTSNN